MVRIADVAAHARVSTATVSRVLSGGGGVSERLVARVQASAAELGYRSNHAARTLRRRRSDTIALIFPDVEQPFFSSIARAVEERGAELGHPVVICNTDEDLEREAFYLELMLAERVAGMIVAPSSEADSDLSVVREAGTAVVAVDRLLERESLTTVLIDHRLGAHALVSELLRDGHRRVAAIFGTTTATPSRLRLRGCQEAVDARRGSSLVVAEGKPRETIGVRQTIELASALTRELLDSGDAPTGFFCGNAIIAQGVWKAVRSAGLRIPDEVGVVSFDDHPMFELLEPAVTVAAQPADRIGTMAVDLLHAHISDPDRPTETHVLEPDIRIRSSCGTHRPGTGTGGRKRPAVRRSGRSS